jgi:predicted AlkP superfamily pyrophosphatase or phosphodiesterase
MQTNASQFFGRLALVVACLLALSHQASAAPSASRAPNDDRIVAMISVDGLANFYFDDPKAEMPTLRKLAADGAHASMRAVAPTVTWPNHATLVTGVSPARHGVVGNNYFDRATRRTITLIADPIFDKDKIVKTPTVFDLAKTHGLTTAAVRWPATRNAHALDWTTPDVHNHNLARQYTTPAVLAACKAEGIDLGSASSVDERLPQQFDCRDALWTHIFLGILRAHRPNLALLHIADVDHVEHAEGPRSREAYAAIKRADQLVGLVWDQLQKDFPGRATLFVVSDHGFSPINRILLPNVILGRAGLVDIKKGKITGGPIAFLSQAGAGFVYILDDSRRAELIEQVRNAFVGVEGVKKVVGVDEFEHYGVADPHDDPHAPDLMLLADMGYVFGDTAAGQLPFEEKPERAGSHGHDPDYPDLHATFVAAGEGIRSGVHLGEIHNTAVAPTIAALLGFEIPKADSQPLAEALAP